MNDNEHSKDTKQENTEKKKSPDEQVGFCFSSFLKISNPNTGEVLLQVRDE